jgi:tRNA-(ms[2]io[6]A)-hydroxylase
VAKISIELLKATDSAWVQEVLNDFDRFLQDHANCERKASALAMSMVVKYPDRSRLIPQLIHIAEEELSHFRQVYTLMAGRDVRLAKDTPDPYVNQLIQTMRSGREERFLDRLLVAGLMECRGAERFRMLSESLEDKILTAFYRELWGSEIKHSRRFIDMALDYFETNLVVARLQNLLEQEAAIIETLPHRPALH